MERPLHRHTAGPQGAVTDLSSRGVSAPWKHEGPSKTGTGAHHRVGIGWFAVGLKEGPGSRAAWRGHAHGCHLSDPIRGARLQQTSRQGCFAGSPLRTPGCCQGLGPVWSAFPRPLLCLHHLVQLPPPSGSPASPAEPSEASLGLVPTLLLGCPVADLSHLCPGRWAPEGSGGHLLLLFPYTENITSLVETAEHNGKNLPDWPGCLPPTFSLWPCSSVSRWMPVSPRSFQQPEHPGGSSGFCLLYPTPPSWCYSQQLPYLHRAEPLHALTLQDSPLPSWHLLPTSADTQPLTPTPRPGTHTPLSWAPLGPPLLWPRPLQRVPGAPPEHLGLGLSPSSQPSSPNNKDVDCAWRVLFYFTIFNHKLYIMLGRDTSLATQRLRLWVPIWGLWVWSGSHMPCCQKTNKQTNIKQEQYCNKFNKDSKNGSKNSFRDSSIKTLKNSFKKNLKIF